MRAIVIAAGKGSRLKHFTTERPKCMVEVNGRSILSYQLEAFEKNDVNDIHIIRGYLADQLVVEGATYHHNPKYEHNNILHSLFCAASAFEGPCLTSYSDIVYTPEVVRAAIESPFDVGLIVDRQWHQAYDGRDDHPVEQAELTQVDDQMRVLRVGKSIGPQDAIGEFIGLARYSAEGARLCQEVFASVRAELGDDDPFQFATLFRRAYLTDLFNEMIDRGLTVGAICIDGGWREIDTVQDLERVQSQGWW